LKIDNPETGGILDRSHRTKTNATQTTKQKRRETRTLQVERKKLKGSKKKISYHVLIVDLHQVDIYISEIFTTGTNVEAINQQLLVKKQ
jgi:ribosomal protein L20